MRTRRLLTTLVIIFLLVLPARRIEAQSSSGIFFPETGHWVSGDFLDFFLAVDDPLALYGFPITDEFIDPILGVRLQYFQRARFEVKDLAGQQPQIVLSPLGKYIYHPEEVQPLGLNTAAAPCKTVSPQYGGYSICYAFLDFYLEHGGAMQFGQPISNLVLEGGLTVQYFENAKFEWHPEQHNGNWVVLADVGRIHFDQSQRDPAYLFTNESNAQFGEVLSLNPSAFVDLAVVKTGDVQTLTVIVHDQNLEPVPGANVSIVVYRAGGDALHTNLQPTGENGITRLSFDVGQHAPESLVPIDIKVTYQGLSATTQAWFRVWW
jgi:hypothetical protein